MFVDSSKSAERFRNEGQSVGSLSLAATDLTINTYQLPDTHWNVSDDRDYSNYNSLRKVFRAVINTGRSTVSK